MDSHMHDFDAHVRAVEEDFEYYRAKRLEPRVLFLARRGILTLYDLLRAAPDEPPPTPVQEPDPELEQRVRHGGPIVVRPRRWDRAHLLEMRYSNLISARILFEQC